MPITPPAVGQEISATNFGIPIANEVNRLTPLVDAPLIITANILAVPQSGFDGTVRDTNLVTHSRTFLATHFYALSASFPFNSNTTGDYWVFRFRTTPGNVTIDDHVYASAAAGSSTKFCIRTLWKPSANITTAIVLAIQRVVGSGTGGMTPNATNMASIDILDLGASTF